MGLAWFTCVSYWVALFKRPWVFGSSLISKAPARDFLLSEFQFDLGLFQRLNRKSTLELNEADSWLVSLAFDSSHTVILPWSELIFPSLTGTSAITGLIIHAPDASVVSSLERDTGASCLWGIDSWFMFSESLCVWSTCPGCWISEGLKDGASTGDRSSLWMISWSSVSGYCWSSNNDESAYDWHAVCDGSVGSETVAASATYTSASGSTASGSTYASGSNSGSSCWDGSVESDTTTAASSWSIASAWWSSAWDGLFGSDWKRLMVCFC
jgi:hypothetical protein